MALDEILHPPVIEWLLESTDPSVRFWTLQHLKNLSPAHSQVLVTQKAIMKSPLVKAILSAQHPDGYWGNSQNIYLKKYTATTHTLLILAELGVKRTPQIERGIEHLYNFQLDSGHFVPTAPKTPRGRASQITDTCCMDANILYYLIHFEYLEDPRTQRLLRFLINNYSDSEGGWACRAYPINPDSVFPANCYMGMIKVLKAFAAIPEEKRPAAVKRILNQVVEVVLENRIYQYLRGQDGKRKAKTGWTRFGFPLFYNSDALEVLDILTRLKVHDKRMQDTINLILSKRGSDGKWLLKHTFNGKMWLDIETKGQPSKWITLRALRVLQHYFTQ